MRDLDKYLQQRGERWHYVRRIPDMYASFDKRGTIRKSLKTKSLEVARAKRDDLVRADNAYWQSGSISEEEVVFDTPQRNLNDLAKQLYEDAKRRAMAKGFIYRSNADLIGDADISDILDRLHAISQDNLHNHHDVEALLGMVAKPYSTISQALQIYCQIIATNDLRGKSDAQKKKWLRMKLGAVNNFISLKGDLPMDKITGNHAAQFFMWWEQRLKQTGTDTHSIHSANRDLRNMRTLYREYWNYVGEPDRVNPFTGLVFRKHNIGF